MTLEYLLYSALLVAYFTFFCIVGFRLLDRDSTESALGFLIWSILNVIVFNVIF